MSTHILLADDDDALREMMTLTLRKEGYRVTAAESARRLEELLSRGDYDLIVADLYLGDDTALAVLERHGAETPPAILVTAQGTVETAAAARMAGVLDYLGKPFTLEQLAKRIEAALRTRTPLVDTETSRGPESMIVGSDPAIVEVYGAVARVAPLGVPVLLRGATGTGKELVARALHRFGSHPEGPFVPVNCGAIPETLIESELFGHRKGAFTGAVRDRAGLVEEARDGTLFLDEVGELPALLQVKLLRFLQDGEIRAVGAAAPARVPVRVVAATHRDLRREVERETFREDLLYRLATYEIELPDLKDRPGDIALLTEHFRRLHAARLGLKASRRLTPEVESWLREQSWPGNVRELEGLVIRALVDLGGLDDLEALRLLKRSRPSELEPEPGVGDDLTLEELERRHIEAVLRRCGGNRTRTAEVLGIERKSLYRKARRLGIALDPEEVS